ncbi:MAG TPA: hypothetical protein VMN78_13245 [Longimicrobiales bacterium]|nr:hypothetical protein [Longimicrobiales bacterium]
MYVANESSDIVSELVYTPGGALERIDDVPVGIMPADIDGAHGLRISPRGDFWYVSLAHGTPYGKLWKFTTDTNELVGATELGLFPASMDIAPGGDLLFIVNFNLHGDPVPSSVSIVHTPTMTEIARPTTCVMPHGSRIDVAGTKHYSTCMHSEQLVEIDTRTLQVSGRFSVAPGREGALPLDDVGAMDDHAAHETGTSAVCSPTWATPGRGARANRFVYVPCNRNAEVLEIDVVNHRVTRRFATGRAPYNLDITPDGRLLLATLKQEQAVAVFDLEEGREIARIPTTRNITHGVVVSPDGRWAFVSNEAVGSTRSTVDVIDLERLEVVASAEVHHQAGGIDAAYE